MMNRKTCLQNASLSSLPSTEVASLMKVAFVLEDGRKSLSLLGSLMFFPLKWVQG